MSRYYRHPRNQCESEWDVFGAIGVLVDSIILVCGTKHDAQAHTSAPIDEPKFFARVRIAMGSAIFDDLGLKLVYFWS